MTYDSLPLLKKVPAKMLVCSNQKYVHVDKHRTLPMYASFIISRVKQYRSAPSTENIIDMRTCLTIQAKEAGISASTYRRGCTPGSSSCGGRSCTDLRCAGMHGVIYLKNRRMYLRTTHTCVHTKLRTICAFGRSGACSWNTPRERPGGKHPGACAAEGALPLPGS